jgi:hypothetical protein
MRADIQGLEITVGELKHLTGRGPIAYTGRRQRLSLPAKL